ncbi:MAG: type II secretion system F family protein [Dermabacter sp.]|nr:type II secretion system F family protein [Dermabacter sp.]
MSALFGGGMATALGAGLGLALGAGLFLLVAMNPWTRPRPVDVRIDPYVRRGQHSRLFSAREYSWASHPFLVRNVWPHVDALRSFGARLVGSHDDIARRLRLAGSTTRVSSYRMEQVLWAVVAFIASAALAASIAATRETSALLLIAGVLVLTAVGPLARDYYLGMQVTRYSSALAREFPTVADLLALAVAAGESPVAAMERVALTSRGPLAHQLGLTVAEIQAGATVEDALLRLGQRTPLDALTRFSEAMAVALERGTPLAEVLRAQAQDARDHSKRALMETAGKREIYMLLPVVFFLLPLVIVFAIFPGLAVLRIGL